MAELAADGAGALLRHQQPSGEARAFGVDCRLALGLDRLGPAFGADQRHEGDGALIFFLVFVIADAAHEVERLMRAAADRNDEPSADGELLLQRLRHFRTAGRDQDGVERGLLREALGAVGEDDLGIGVTQARDPLARLVGQHVVALDGEHLAGNAAQHRRRVARAGADLEHRVGGPKLQQLDHAGDDIRLRDGLPRLDGQRRILIAKSVKCSGTNASRGTAPMAASTSGSRMLRAARCRTTMMARSRACRSGRPANLAVEGAIGAKTTGTARRSA